MHDWEVIAGRFVMRKLTQRKDGRWWADCRDILTGRVRRRLAKDTARRRAREEIKAWLEVQAKGPVGGVLRVSEAFPEWLELREPDLRPRTIAAYRDQWTRVLRPVFGEMRVSEVTVADVERFVAARRRRGNAPRTVGIFLSTLRGFFRWAARRGLTQHNPMAGVPVPGPRRDVARALDPDEARRLLAACRPARARMAVAIGLYTGLRKRNVIGLRWTQIDLEARRISIAGEEMKAHRSHEVPIHPALARMLVDAKRNRRIIDPEGSVLGYRKFDSTWYRVLRRAGIGRVRYHDLRHTFAHWIAARASWAVLRALLGHAVRTPTDLYTQGPSWDERLAAIDLLPDLTRPEPAEGKAVGKPGKTRARMRR